MFGIILGVMGDRLTVGDIVRQIPHDPVAFFVYALVVLFGGFIWYGSRNKSS